MVGFRRKLDKFEIEQGLIALSDKLGENPPAGMTLPVRAVVAGGVIALFQLGNRTSTHDVDFALDFGQIQAENALQRAADTEDVRKPSLLGNELHRYWFNPAMSSYLNMAPYRGAYNEALYQGDVIFHSNSLILYAAPWKYQLYRKISRISKCIRQGVHVRDEDLLDAVDLVHHFNMRWQRPLTFDEIVGWYDDKSARLSESAATMISERYRQTYGGAFVL